MVTIIGICVEQKYVYANNIRCYSSLVNIILYFISNTSISLQNGGFPTTLQKMPPSLFSTHRICGENPAHTLVRYIMPSASLFAHFINTHIRLHSLMDAELCFCLTICYCLHHTLLFWLRIHGVDVGWRNHPESSSVSTERCFGLTTIA